jgi:hypothetical protein
VRSSAAIGALPYPTVAVKAAGDWLGVFAWLAEHQHIIGKPLPADRAVLDDLLVKQPDRLGALLRDYRVFPDADLAMEYPTGVLVGADDLTAEIAHADMAVTDFRRRKLHAMNGVDAPRHGDAQQFLDQEGIVLPEAGPSLFEISRSKFENLYRPSNGGLWMPK